MLWLYVTFLSLSDKLVIVLPWQKSKKDYSCTCGVFFYVFYKSGLLLQWVQFIELSFLLCNHETE